tara:strand:+ start:240 stop:509 length:270 start_codon:yes stop_codon:yes gene_type:complete
MNHPAAMCEAMIAETDSLPASTVASLSALVDNAICLPGRNYKNFQSLEFLVRFIFIFVWAIRVTVYFFVDRLSSPPRRSCGPYFSYSAI